MEKAERNVRQRTLKAIHSMKKSELARVVRQIYSTALSHPVSTLYSIPIAKIKCFYDAKDKNASE